MWRPHDFCDINSPAADSLPHGHQSSHARDLLLSNQGSVPSVLPTSGASSSLPGSSGMVHLNKLFSPSGPAGASSRYYLNTAGDSCVAAINVLHLW